MACSQDTVPALDRLLQLASVNIKQKTTKLAPNVYTVIAPDDEVLFRMKEEGNMFTALNKGCTRAFQINAVDSQEKPVFSLRRPFAYSSDKVEMSLLGELVSIVRMERTLMKAVFSINDASDRPMLRIKKEMHCSEFEVQTVDKRPIGTISKKFRGVLKEMFSYADDYVITFPVDLDVRFKLAIISACILIDYKFYES